ncbi:MAG: hypothetical protein GY807_13195 [Gammaproteobacteria bacterium]|nr:hypothetical protein [Gammaproteobacteria bacterium]
MANDVAVGDTYVNGPPDRTGGTLYLVNLARAAALLGCEKVGNPAVVSAKALVRRGWHEHVWAAYLVTVSGPVSQKTKAEITGITPRTQRNYQVDIGEARQNYAALPLKADKAEGARAATGKQIFINSGGRAVQRLPDIRTVPAFISSTLNKGRTRKAQRQLNHLNSLVTCEAGVRFGDLEVKRLFYDTPKAAAAVRKREPDSTCDKFYPEYCGPNANRWVLVPALVEDSKNPLHALDIFMFS